MQHVLSRYTAGSPLSLMVRIGLEHCFSSAALDEVFEGSRTKTYTNELAFSATVDLLGLVVTGGQPSVRAAYPHGEVGVTLKAVYEKLQNVEPAVSAAMVRGTADRAAMLIRSMKGERAPWLSGFRVMVLDGNHLAATDRRLAVLREAWPVRCRATCWRSSSPPWDWCGRWFLARTATLKSG